MVGEVVLNRPVSVAWRPVARPSLRSICPFHSKGSSYRRRGHGPCRDDLFGGRDRSHRHGCGIHDAGDRAADGDRRCDLISSHDTSRIVRAEHRSMPCPTRDHECRVSPSSGLPCGPVRYRRIPVPTVKPTRPRSLTALETAYTPCCWSWSPSIPPQYCASNPAETKPIAPQPILRSYCVPTLSSRMLSRVLFASL